MQYEMNWLREGRGVEVIRTAIPKPNVRGKDMDVFEISLRLGAAVAAGLVVGIEREITGHPAGVRTHVLVALGAAMFSLAGAYGFADVTHGPNVDPARIAAQVASGIGFIGAGAIIRDRGAIKGLTTAATVWLAASCGVAAAGGSYLEVSVGTVFVLITLIGLRLVRPSKWRQKQKVQLEIEYSARQGTLAPILETLKSSGTVVTGIDVRDEPDTSMRHLSLRVTVPARSNSETVVADVAQLGQVHRVAVSDEDG